MITIFKKLFDLLNRRERRNFLLLVGMILLMALFNTVGVAAVLPFLAVLTNPQIIHENTLLSATYDFLGFDDDLSFTLFLSFALFLIIVFGLAFQALTHYAQRRFGAMREYSLSTRLLSRYLRHPYVWFLQRNSTELTKNILTEVHLVINAAMMPALGLIAHSTVAILILVLLVLVDPLVTAASLLLIGGGYAIIYYSIRPILSKLGETRLRANTDRYRIVDEALGGIKEVQVLGIEGAYLTRFTKPARRFASVETKLPILTEIPRLALEALSFGGILLFLFILLVRTQGNVLDVVPVIGLFAFAAIRMLPAMAKVYSIFATLRFALPVLNAVHKEFFEESVVGRSWQRGPTIPLLRSLELQNIRYAYPGAAARALDGLNFTVRANTTVGLVGSSGSGKTTTVDIILGLLDPDHGVIRVDETELTSQLLPDWQRSIGYVPQAIFLSDDTITANIALGIDPDAIDHRAVKRAAKLAELDHFVGTKLPEGYDTLVGQSGVRLSGGQRQRIGIARALYHNPSVLVFDEATSALDNITEAAVMNAIKALTGLKTIIMVAHRLSTIADCDQIIFLDAGRVAAVGTFNQLLNSNLLFREMAAANPTSSDKHTTN